MNAFNLPGSAFTKSLRYACSNRWQIYSISFKMLIFIVKDNLYTYIISVTE